MAALKQTRADQGRARHSAGLLQQLHRSKDVVLVGLHNTPVHEHFIHDEVRLRAELMYSQGCQSNRPCISKYP